MTKDQGPRTTQRPTIALLSDFGNDDPYAGQMEEVLKLRIGSRMEVSI